MATPTALRATRYWALGYSRNWRASVFSSFVTPTLFLAAMGLGLGRLVDQGQGSATIEGVRYVTFIAPGLLASTAMSAAAQEATFPVLGSIKWTRHSYAMLASPLRPVDVALGHLVWMLVRLVMVCSAFALVILAFGAAGARVLLAVPAAVLTGAAFAPAIAAFSASLERESAFAGLFRFGIIPLSLFSGAFFPVEQLPGLVRPIVAVTPLFHGVELCRALALGEATLGEVAGRAAYLAAWAAVGTWLAVRRFQRRLVS